MTQGFFVRNLEEKDVQSLVELTSNFSSRFNIDNSVTCVGPTICNFGINNSQGMLNCIIKTFEGVNSDIKDALPRVLISGCHNSCGQHQKGIIGFTGKRKRVEDGTIATYSVSFNGRVGANARFGEVYGDIAAKKIPQFLLELAHLKVKSGYIDFVEFIKNKQIEVTKLVEKYSSLEGIIENPDLYSDFQ